MELPTDAALQRKQAKFIAGLTSVLQSEGYYGLAEQCVELTEMYNDLVIEEKPSSEEA